MGQSVAAEPCSVIGHRLQLRPYKGFRVWIHRADSRDSGHH